MIKKLVVIPNLDLLSNEDKIVDKINEIIEYLNTPQRVLQIELLNQMTKQYEIADKEIKRLREGLRKIEDNHFECDGGEACKAHNIAKSVLLRIEPSDEHPNPIRYKTNEEQK